MNLQRYGVRSNFFAYTRCFCERWDRGIKVFLALASSGSIAAWTVWRDLSAVWGAIIAASQLVNAIKEHLPFEKRLKAVRQLASKLETAFVQWETAWSEVASGDLSDSAINSRLSELKKAKVDLIGHSLSEGALPDRPELHAQAKARAELYFETIYSTGEDDVKETQR